MKRTDLTNHLTLQKEAIDFSDYEWCSIDQATSENEKKTSNCNKKLVISGHVEKVFDLVIAQSDVWNWASNQTAVRKIIYLKDHFASKTSNTSNKGSIFRVTLFGSYAQEFDLVDLEKDSVITIVNPQIHPRKKVPFDDDDNDFLENNEVLVGYRNYVSKICIHKINCLAAADQVGSTNRSEQINDQFDVDQDQDLIEAVEKTLVEIENNNEELLERREKNVQDVGTDDDDSVKISVPKNLRYVDEYDIYFEKGTDDSESYETESTTDSIDKEESEHELPPNAEPAEKPVNYSTVIHDEDFIETYNNTRVVGTGGKLFKCELCEEPRSEMNFHIYYTHLISSHHEKELCKYLQISNPQKVRKCQICPHWESNGLEFILHHFTVHDKAFLIQFHQKKIAEKKQENKPIKKVAPPPVAAINNNSKNKGVQMIVPIDEIANEEGGEISRETETEVFREDETDESGGEVSWAGSDVDSKADTFVDDPNGNNSPDDQIITPENLCRFSCVVSKCSQKFNTDFDLENHVLHQHKDQNLSKEEINELHLAKYQSEQERLNTYSDWSNPHVQPRDLTNAGFINTGREDFVQCVFCAGIVGGWEKGDCPKTEHENLFPFCGFVQGLDVYHYEDISARRQSKSWENFLYNKALKRSKCKICGMEISKPPKQLTFHMDKHFQNHHAKEVKISEKAKQVSSIKESEPKLILQELISKPKKIAKSKNISAKKIPIEVKLDLIKDISGQNPHEKATKISSGNRKLAKKTSIIETESAQKKSTVNSIDWKKFFYEKEDKINPFTPPSQKLVRKRLTPSQKSEIIMKKDQGWRFSKIAKLYDINESSVRTIIKRRTQIENEKLCAKKKMIIKSEAKIVLQRLNLHELDHSVKKHAGMDKDFQNCHQNKPKKIGKSKKNSAKKTSIESKSGHFKETSGQNSHQKATKRSGMNKKLTKQTLLMESESDQFKDISAYSNPYGSTSHVWKHFLFNKSTEKAKCKYCSHNQIMTQNTTSLNRHLKRFHPSAIFINANKKSPLQASSVKTIKSSTLENKNHEKSYWRSLKRFTRHNDELLMKFGQNKTKDQSWHQITKQYNQANGTNFTKDQVVRRHEYNRYMETKSHEDDDEKKAPVCGLCQRLFKSQPSLDHHYRKIHKISAVDGHALQ